MAWLAENCSQAMKHQSHGSVPYTLILNNDSIVPVCVPCLAPMARKALLSICRRSEGSNDLARGLNKKASWIANCHCNVMSFQKALIDIQIRS